MHLLTFCKKEFWAFNENSIAVCFEYKDWYEAYRLATQIRVPSKLDFNLRY